MRERLLIVGAGELGREVLNWALQVPPARRSWDIQGFLDEQADRLDRFELPAGIVGSPDHHVILEHDRMVVAIADADQRRAMVERLAGRGARFTSIIHPKAIIGLNNRWGVGCLICPGVVVTTNVTIGDHVILRSHAGLGHDAVVESYCTLQTHSQMAAGSRLAAGALLGARAVMMPGTVVGPGARVDLNSAVLENIPAQTRVAGVPARMVLPSPAPEAIG